MPIIGIQAFDICTQCREIGQVVNSPVAETNAVLEPIEMANLSNLAEVPLDEGLEVVAEGFWRLELLIVKVRIEAGIQKLVDCLGRARLPSLQRPKRHHA